MKSLSRILKLTEKALRDNSPLILASLGAAGVVTTAYLTGKATIKAVRLVDQNKDDYDKLDTDSALLKAVVRDCWKLYLPAVGAGVLSVGAIIGSNRIGARRAAAVATAYSLSERAFSEYRDKVVQKIGANKETEIRDEVAQERVDRGPHKGIIIATDDSKVLCHDAFSNQYFMSDMEALRKAQNDVNAQILHSDFATISDLYHAIGAPELEPTSVSGEMGWNTDKMLELDFSTVLYKDKTPCISINFVTIPIRDPWRFL